MFINKDVKNSFLILDALTLHYSNSDRFKYMYTYVSFPVLVCDFNYLISQLKLELIESSGSVPLGAAGSKKYGLPILITICHNLGGVHCKCTGRWRFSSSDLFHNFPFRIIRSFSQALLCYHASVCSLAAHSRISPSYIDFGRCLKFLSTF